MAYCLRPIVYGLGFRVDGLLFIVCCLAFMVAGLVIRVSWLGYIV